MELDELFERSQRRRKKNLRWAGLLACAFFLGLLSFFPGLSAREERLYEGVKAAEDQWYQWRVERGLGTDEKDDPHHTGLIGLEWSPLSTTLGNLKAKRTAADPRWAVAFRRQFEGLGVGAGDVVPVYSSGSFPGLLLSCLMALESLEARPYLIVSLGASTYGANVPGAGWLQMNAFWREKGFLSSWPEAVTWGNDGEVGDGTSEEGKVLMKKDVARFGLTVLELRPSEQMIAEKTARVLNLRPKVFVSIGGSEANLGTDKEAALALSPGLIEPGKGVGNGVIGRVSRAGVPVLHCLELHHLAPAWGIPYDGAPGKQLSGRATVPIALALLILFSLACLFWKRWESVPLEPSKKEPRG